MNQVIEIPIDKILINPHVTKQINLKVLPILVESIRQNGLIEPIKVRKLNEHYGLIDGLLRLEACKQLNRETIQAEIMEPLQAIHHTPPIMYQKITKKEMGKSIRKVLDQGMSIETLAEKIGKPVETLQGWLDAYSS